MEEKHQNRIYSVSPDGRWLVDNQEVDSYMIFEEEAKNLLEKELMEGPLNYYPEDDDNYPLSDCDDSDPNMENQISEDEDILNTDRYFDINYDGVDFIY